jgi:alpha-tubulin suppressor-like RCC1 family protein
MGAARFNSPRGLAIDNAGNLLVADTLNHAVRKVTPQGVVTTLAGTLGLGGVRNGLTVAVAHGTNALVAQLWTPDRLAVRTDGLIYAIDTISRSIRTIDTNGLIATYRGSNYLTAFLLPEVLTANPPAFPSQLLSGYVSSISAGGYVYGIPGPFSLALRGDGTVLAWGTDTLGQTDVPPGLSNVVAIAAAQVHSVALKSDGTVVAWGSTPDYGMCYVPAGLTGVVAVAASSRASVALKNDGTVVAWGRVDTGEAIVPPGLSNVVNIAAGEGGQIFALKSDGTVVAWGDNGYGGCNVPAGLSNVVALSAGQFGSSVALKGDGTLVLWGDGTYEGWDSEVVSGAPSGLSNVVAVSLGFEQALALTGDGTVTAWGSSYYAPAPGETSVPLGLSNVVAVAAGCGQSFALKRDATVVAWGPTGIWDDELNMPVPTLPTQTSDTLASNAAIQGFTAGVITPDGRSLIADQFGLRLFDYSDRLQKQAAAWVLNDLTNSAGSLSLNTAGQALTGWHMLLQNLATYGLSGALANNDALHALLFGGQPLVDLASAAAFLSGLTSTPDWRPTHSDLGTTPLQRIDELQPLLLKAVLQAAPNPNPAGLFMVTDTLNRLNLLLAAHQPIPVITATVTWNNPVPIVYGAALGINQLNATASVPGSETYSPPTGTVLPAGTNTLSLVFSPTDTADYGSLTTSVSLVVLPAQLKVTANNATRFYDQINPVFTGSITGVTNGDNLSATYSCSATTASPPGNYPITPSLVDPSNREANYTVSLANGTLTVLPKGASALDVNNADAVYGIAAGKAGNYWSGTYGLELWVLNGTNVPVAINTATNVAAYRDLAAGGFMLAQTWSEQTMSEDPGTLLLGEVDLPMVNPPGGNVVLALAAWTGDATNWPAAVAARVQGGLIAFVNETVNTGPLPPPIPPDLAEGWDAYGQDLVMTPLAPLPNTPVLTATPAGQTIVLSWPQQTAGTYNLETTTNLAPQATWTAVTNAPVPVNSQNTVTLQLSGVQQFFRLHNQ